MVYDSTIIVFMFLILNTLHRSKSLIGASEIECPAFCHCSTLEKKATCSINIKRKRQIRYIPRLPEYVTWFLFSNNRIPNVTKHALLNLTFNEITHFSLQTSNIRHISPDAFENLLYLKRLEINQNFHVTPEMISKLIPRLHNVSELYLMDNNWKSLPINMFNGANQNNIRGLSFERNRLRNVFGGTFSILTGLSYISFKSNKVMNSIKVQGLPPSLRSIDLSSNNFLEFPDFCNENRSDLPVLQILNMDNNFISSVSAKSFKCLNNLEKLSFDRNMVTILKNNTFRHLSSLYHLSLLHQRVRFRKVYPAAFNITTLTELNFAENHYDFNNRKRSVIFNFCQNLTYLDLGSNNFKLDQQTLQHVFMPLRKLERLILQNVGLRTIPTGIFPKMTYLRTLILQGNDIIGWNDDPEVFWNMTSLWKLSLENNKIKLINKTTFPESMLSKLKYLDLSVNDFSCSCELMWFRNWIRKNKTVTLRNWPSGYKCKYPPVLNRKLLKSFNPSEESCDELTPVQYTYFIIISCVSLFSIVVIFVILYKSRWHIRYWIYLLRSKRRTKDDAQIPLNFIYDGFVIYCQDDREWVHDRLIPKLEEEHGFQLCIHYRDFEIGKLIIDNIVECMERSRKVIIILSNNFARSEWCHLELRLSHGRFLQEGSDVLVLVMLKEIDNRHLSSSLKALITTMTYAIWTDDDVGEALFWDQMTTAMRH